MTDLIRISELKQVVNQSRVNIKHPDGYVYVIRWCGHPEYGYLWKIGMSRKPKRRLKELKRTYGDRLEVQSMFQIKVRGDCDYLETVLHRIYQGAEHTIAGHREWFDIGGAEIAWLRSLQAIDCSILRKYVRQI